MNRRNFIQFALAASAGALIPGYAADTLKPIARARPKRGLAIGMGEEEQWLKKLQSVGANWFYSWSKNLPEDLPSSIEYVPMIFKSLSDDDLKEAGATFKADKTKHLLGFNEPDGARQANMTVEEALALWPKLMALGLPLGSPACIHADKEWMTAFMQGVKDKKLRVDFITVHSYGDLNATGFMNRLESIRKLYRRPIWVTEFAVGDWKAETAAQNRYSPKEIVKFMEQVLPALDRCDFVERYAWYPANKESRALGPCALFNEDGSLTPPGAAYRSL
jgi:hypothetical protein